MRPTIQTVDGQFFDFMRPEAYRFRVSTIAHALSLINRFTGHTSMPYSVAQHSVLVSHAVPEHLAMEGLCHDAHEFAIGDMAAPLKMLLPEYKALEGRVERALRKAWGLPAVMPPEVKDADMVLLATEKRDLMPERQPGDHDEHWRDLAGIEPLRQRIVAWTPEAACQAFLHRYAELRVKSGVVAPISGSA